jgi:hypothetical protein
MSDQGQNRIDLVAIDIVDDDSVKTTYIDGYWGVSITDGVMKLNLYEVRTSPVEPPISKKYIVARLAIPLASFLKVTEALNGLAREVKELLEKNNI